MASINHLDGLSGNTAEILAGFTDEQLTEQYEWAVKQQSEYLAGGSPHAAYRMTVLRSAIKVEQEHRQSPVE